MRPIDGGAGGFYRWRNSHARLGAGHRPESLGGSTHLRELSAESAALARPNDIPIQARAIEPFPDHDPAGLFSDKDLRQLRWEMRRRTG